MPAKQDWVVLAGLLFVTFVVCVILRRRKRPAPQLLTAAFVAAGLFSILCNVELAVRHRDTQPWKKLMSEETSLVAKSLGSPRNGFTFGNEVYLFLNDYLRGKELVMTEETGAAFLDAHNGMLASSSRARNELVFATMTVQAYNDRLTGRKAQQLLERPYFGIGEADNFAIFILGRSYQESSRVYLMSDGRRYFLVPESLMSSSARAEGSG